MQRFNGGKELYDPRQEDTTVVQSVPNQRLVMVRENYTLRTVFYGISWGFYDVSVLYGSYFPFNLPWDLRGFSS